MKVILIFYSLESFFFKKLNRSSRDKDTTVIATLGPFAVALNRVINNVQSKRSDGIKGEITCYSGISFLKATIELWKRKSYLSIEGYRSTSLDERIAINFSARNETDDLATNPYLSNYKTRRINYLEVLQSNTSSILSAWKSYYWRFCIKCFREDNIALSEK